MTLPGADQPQPLLELGGTAIGDALLPVAVAGSRRHKIRFFADRVEILAGPRARPETFPLHEVRHLEAVQHGVVGIRVGPDMVGHGQLFDVATGPLTSGDLLDQIDVLLSEQLPDHLYSMSDADGVRYSRVWQLAEVTGHTEMVTRVAGRGRIERSGINVVTERGRFSLRKSTSTLFLRAEHATGRQAFLELWDGCIYHASGLLLATIEVTEAGGVTIVLGSGEVLELLSKTRKLLCAGHLVGSFQRKTIVGTALAEIHGLLFLLAIYHLDRVVAEVPGTRRHERRRAAAMFYGGGVLMAVLSVGHSHGWLIGVTLIAVMALAHFSVPHRRVAKMSGDPAEDSAHRRRPGGEES